MGCEIEFLPVGSASKPGDAIIIRYGNSLSYSLMTIDGGNLESGKLVVEHVKKYFGANAVISHAVLTHPDADHASGLREVLDGLPVKNVWLHMPWAFVTDARKYLADKKSSDDALVGKIIKEYDIITDVVSMAVNKNIAIHMPFAGDTIGPFHVLSPHKMFYTALMPQFDRTPDADQVAIEADGFWIGEQPDSFIRTILEKAAAKVQKWIGETWEDERLKDGGITSPSNESSIILYGDFGNGRRTLLTGDAGVWGLTLAAYQAEQLKLPLKAFSFVQIPHHGSRRNVGPTILNRLIGPSQPRGSASTFTAFVSAPADDDTHPRKMVLNAFIRRGARVMATQGQSKIHYGGFPARDDYTNVQPMPFAPKVEDYD